MILANSLVTIEGRYLALTADFRSVLGEILIKHLGVADLKPVFPGFENSPRKIPGANQDPMKSFMGLCSLCLEV